MHNTSLPVLAAFVILLLAVRCSTDHSNTQMTDCIPSESLDLSRGVCDVTLPYQEQYSEQIVGDVRVITANGIPDHEVGLFGHVAGALNPNAISTQAEVFHITTKPEKAVSLTSLLATSGPHAGPQYVFGIVKNGVELDPIAAEPFPHHGLSDPNVNWAWNLEALNAGLGLDCNNAHVQPSGNITTTVCRRSTLKRSTSATTS